MKGYFRRRGCKCGKKKCTCGAKWSFTIDIGIDPATGERKQKTKSGFATKAEAEAAAAALILEIQDGTYVSETNILFKDFAQEWLSFYKNTGNVKISTVRVRQHELDKLMPYFANLKIKDITSKMYQLALIDLKEQGFASNTISGIHTTGQMLFRKAIEFNLIKTSPAQFAKLPRTQITVEEIEQNKDVPKYLEKDELRRFLKTAKEKGLDRDYVIFLTLAYSGIRAGELCALKWPDINFDEGTISITKTLYNPSNVVPDYNLLTPKTKKSIRKIEMDQTVMDELARHKTQQNTLKMKYRDTYYDKNFVFAKSGDNHRGYPELVKTIEIRMKRLLKLAGLNEKLTPHSLRHTHTSLLAEAGVGLVEIMDRLGHADDQTTKNIYLHVTKSMKKEASQKFSELMRSL
ncbi:tyrosine-type recombinase/integrase [Heliophilum fasciatum]|uniref:Site-specific recombinase XerD n=1 Tax=Heliophilum fasciatum TaxID=35700 RepID=A0A4R2RNS9_9FIRM|nr:tyrosine-type recombinase/integrase [Heliophilum fasciatum]MCW2277773.1 integrase [Heliophilum fasciatum]TCP64734.1 site-specific recombinase XerD [Heliophilum fasciatum]